MVTAELTSAQAAALQRRNGVLRVEANQSEFLDWGVRAVWGDRDRRGSLPSMFSNRAFVLDTGSAGISPAVARVSTTGRVMEPMWPARSAASSPGSTP